MKLDFVRNIGISAHIDSGKTTLTERILFYGGKIHKIGEVKGGGDGATMDHMDLERERGITITSAATQVHWDTPNGDDYTINVIDTPGHVDFTVEVERSLRVLDGAILVLCSVGGVQSQSLTVDRQMKRYGVPRLAFINKCDRTGANPKSVIKQIREKLHITPVPLQMTVGLESNLKGVIDFIEMRAVYFDGEKGENVRYEAIPAELLEEAKAGRAEMLEALSLYDDELMEMLLEEAEVPVDKIHALIRKTTLSREIVPVLMGSAFKNNGVQELLNAVCRYLPSPPEIDNKAIDINAMQAKEKETSEAQDGNNFKVILKSEDDLPLVAMAFKITVEQFGQLTYTRIYQGKIKKGESYRNTRTGKTVRFGRLVRMHANDRVDIEEAGAGDIIAVVGIDCASGDTFCGEGVNYALENIYVPEAVIRLSIEPADRGSADKLGKALERFRREDPTFRVMTDEETGQTLIAGMGQLHLDVYIERIKREYKCETIVGEPRVAYRETPTKAVTYDYKHKKQSGGSGQYAHVKGVIGPAPENSESPFMFINEVSQGRIPKEYIAPVEKGFRRALVKGPLCECEVVNVQAQLQDGSYHDVDSSEMAFEICGFNCMREMLREAGMALLEPIMNLEVEVPDEYQGSVTGHLSSKRGIITNSDTRYGTCVINAEVPLASMFDYANELRSMTQGKGGFSMEFLCYRQAPKSIQEEVVARRRKEKEEKLAMA